MASLIEIREHLSLAQSHRLIANNIIQKRPFLAARLGSTESKSLVRSKWRRERNAVQKLVALMTRFDLPFWSKFELRKLRDLSGFFPIEKSAFQDFERVMLESMVEIDLLGSWNNFESEFYPHLDPLHVTMLNNLEPWFGERPWTQELAGRKVLVIHPFASSIEKQYREARDEIFPGSDVLPDFDLLVIKAVQSLGGISQSFNSWSDGLKFMTEQAFSSNADVALIGCGSYGLPLAANIKKSGMSVVHLGGALQLLFGIRGRRWDERTEYSDLFNSSWVRPKASEKPAAAHRVERGIYW